MANEILAKRVFLKDDITGDYLIPFVDIVVPTNVSEFTNDAGYLVSDDLTGYAKSSEIPTVVNTYSATGTNAISGKGVKAALDTLSIPTTTSSVTSGSAAALTSGGAYTNLITKVEAGTSANQIKVTKAGTTSTITVNNVAHATAADSATNATNAVNATNDGDGNDITETYATKSEIPTVPTKVSAFTNDAGYISAVAWGDVTGKPSTFTPSAHNQASNTITAMTGYAKAETAAAIVVGDSLNTAIGKLEKALDGKQASGSYAAESHTHTKSQITDFPTIPTVNNKTITIQKNGTNVDTFTLNQSTNKTINITVPTTAADVSALPSSTKYAASIVLSVDSDTYVVSAQLKDQDGNNLGTAGTIDLPLESVVVSGSYNSSTKKVVLTLQSGSTIEFSVADLISGLQSEITSTNKLSADLIKDGTTNKVVTATEKSTWNSKQAAISDLATIRSNASSGASAASTIAGYGDIVTHDADEFAEVDHTHSEYLTAVAWDDVTGKPSTFTPASHNQASNTITAMTGYAKASTVAAITTGDSLNTAIGKLEKALDGKQASGSYVTTSRTVNGKALSSNISLTASDVGALPDSTVIPVVVNTYSATGTDAISGKGVKAALDTLSIPTKLSDLTDDLGSSPTHTHSQYLTSVTAHNQASNTINALTGYSKSVSGGTGALATTDTLNKALAKLENALDGKQASGSYLTGITSAMVTEALGFTPYNSTNPNGYTSNTGTITGIKMNGSSKGTSGVVDLGTVATSDTKNTAGSTDTSSKIFLIGATSQAANPQTYSQDTVFVDTSGQLNSANPAASTNSTVVATTKWVMDKGFLTSALQVGDNISNLVNDAGYITTVAWGDVTGKPSTFTPASHNQASNTINAMTGYSKASSVSAISTSDSLNTAIGKLEKALDGKQASGSYAAADHTHSQYLTGITSSDVTTALGFTPTANTGTITGITMNGSSKGTSGVVDLGTVLTAHQTIKQDGVTGATTNRFGTCSTAAATAAKVVSITSGTFNLEAGARVSVKFTNANTASNPTLNVSSKGAKNIFHKGARITTGDNKALLAGVCDFIYDGTQWHLVGNYIDSNTTYSQGTGISISGTTINHSNSVTAGTVGTSSSTSGSSVAVPYVTYDAQGHITATGTHVHSVTGFAASSHTHDDRYYTESEIEELFTTLYNDLNTLYQAM